MKPPHKDYTCPKCGEWIEILPTTASDLFICPWCDEWLTLDVDVDNYGMSNQRDLSKLISARPHMEAMLKHAEAKNEQA